MGYILYTSVFLLLVLSSVLYLLRSRLPILRDLHGYSPVPTSFRDDVEAGLHSTNFDLANNITEGDERSGLDENAKREVQKIMKRKGVGFDEARKLFMESAFKKNNIGADGLPKDPKFVSFS